jgi:hypothetical protein
VTASPTAEANSTKPEAPGAAVFDDYCHDCGTDADNLWLHRPPCVSVYAGRVTLPVPPQGQAALPPGGEITDDEATKLLAAWAVYEREHPDARITEWMPARLAAMRAGKPGRDEPYPKWRLERRMLAWFERDDCPVASEDRQYFRALFDRIDWHTLTTRRGAADLALTCGVHPRSAQDALNRMRRTGAITRTVKGGRGPGDPSTHRLNIP